MDSPVDVARELTRLLAPTDAASAAAFVTKILWFLVDLTKSEGGSILLPHSTKASFTQHAVCKLTGDQLASMQAEWAPAETWVLRGQPVVTPARVFQPILDRELGQVVAVLYLDGPQRFDAQVVQPYTEALGEALVRSQQVAFEDGGGHARPTGRAGLLKTLHEHEWNLSRVARVLGISRRTVYLRMQRYGIDRQRVPKSVTKLRSPR
jgi:hypothetical protein